jgi:hypothetical protein
LEAFSMGQGIKKLSFANKGIMQILNVQVSYYFLFTAIICFIFPEDLLFSRLGNWFMVGTSLFWLVRTVQQFVFLRVNHYKVHLLTLIFLIGAALFAVPVVMKD